jgi:hypothetical protein
LPARPANSAGLQDILSAVYQLIRELQIRVDNLGKVIPIHRVVAATGTLNFGSIAPGGSVQRNVQVAGAGQQGAVSASPQLSLGAVPLAWSAQVSGSGVVTVTLVNHTTGTVTPNVVKWNVTCTQ